MNFNKDWKFILTKDLNGQLMDLCDESFKTVDIPHDFSIEQPYDKERGEGCTAYLLGGTGWYRKKFITDESMKNSIVTVCFDGVMENCDCYINEHYLGFHPYGYSPFNYDITEYLAENGKENVLAVRVEHENYANSRWYAGSGIYRNVNLDIRPLISIPFWGTKIETPAINDKCASLKFTLPVENNTLSSVQPQLTYQISSPTGKIILSDTLTVPVESNDINNFEHEVLIDSPLLWDTENPNLYCIKFTLSSDFGTQIKSYNFGFRTICFDKDKGFFLNGKYTRIKGVCLHHDAGLFGSAVTKSVWKSRLEELKQMGCNAIRTSHNPVSYEFLDLCDEMGILVQEEFFDEWDNPKDKRNNGGEKIVDNITQGYNRFFQEWAKTDLQSTMLRDINHPSIIQWSIGNEIEWTYPKYNKATGYFTADATGGYFFTLPPYSLQRIRENIKKVPQDHHEIGETAKKLSKWVKELDITRPVIANCILPSVSYETGYVDALDLVGYSYRRVIYDYGHKNYNKPVMGTENVAQWHEWKAVLEREFVAGIFLWTGFDYLGEAGAAHKAGWPTKTAQTGNFDSAGFESPSYYMFRSLWYTKNDTVKIYTQTDEDSQYILNGDIIEEKEKGAWKHRLWHWYPVNSHWNYEPEQKTIVEVYSNCEKVELFLNSKSLGVKLLADFEDHIYKWAVNYESGELKAVGYNGNKKTQDIIETSGKPVCAKLTTRGKCKGKIGDSVFVIAQLVDKDLKPVYNVEKEVNFTLSDNVVFQGVDNGFSGNVQPYNCNNCITNNGHCLIAFKLTDNNKVTVTAEVDGIKTNIII